MPPPLSWTSQSPRRRTSYRSFVVCGKKGDRFPLQVFAQASHTIVPSDEVECLVGLGLVPWLVGWLPRAKAARTKPGWNTRGFFLPLPPRWQVSATPQSFLSNNWQTLSFEFNFRSSMHIPCGSRGHGAMRTKPPPNDWDEIPSSGR